MSDKPRDQQQQQLPHSGDIESGQRRRSCAESVKLTLESDPSTSISVPCYRNTPVRELILAAMLMAPKKDKKYVLTYKSSEGTDIDLDPERTLVSYGFDLYGVCFSPPLLFFPPTDLTPGNNAQTELFLRQPKKEKKEKHKISHKKTKSMSFEKPAKTLRGKPTGLFRIFSSSFERDEKADAKISFHAPHIVAMSIIEAWAKSSSPSAADITALFSPTKKADREASDLRSAVEKEGRAQSSCTAQGAAALIHQYLKGLPGPLFPRDLFPQYIADIASAVSPAGGAPARAKLGSLIEKLPGANRAAARRLLVFIRQLEVASHKTAGGSAMSAIVTIFQPFVLSSTNEMTTTGADEKAAALLASAMGILPELFLFNGRCEQLTQASGEEAVATFDGVVCFNRVPPAAAAAAAGTEAPPGGELWVTNYRLLHRYPPGVAGPEEYEPISESVRGIVAIEQEGAAQARIVFADMSVHYIVIQRPDPDSVSRVVEVLQRLLARELQKAPYAARNRELTPAAADWFAYDAAREMARMKVPPDKWRVTKLNEDYTLCSSYPSKLIVPAAIDDAWLKSNVALFSKRRFPVLAWYNPAGGGSLCRCFAPTSADALKIVERIAEARPVIVADTSSASVTQTQQVHAQVIPLDLPRPSQAQEAFIELVCRDLEAPLTAAAGDTAAEGRACWATRAPFVGAWMTHIRTLVRAAAGILSLLKKYAVLLQHSNSDWCDSDCQVSTIVQVLADPYYRTIQGLSILIEKEWLASGFPFAMRCSYSADAASAMSPAFLQTVSAIFCLTNDFPSAFEFNEEFLLFLVDSVYSGRFGTFLGNTEVERNSFRRSTLSAWTYVKANIEQFRNPFYGGRASNAGFLEISQLYDPFFWSGYAFRHHPLGLQGARRLRQKTTAIITQIQKPYEALTIADLPTLHATEMDLFWLPPFTFKMAKLQTLDVSWSNLNYLPSEIGYLSNLRELDLCGNELAFVNGGGLFHVLSRFNKSLELIDLSQNHVTSLPEDFARIASLKIVLLSRNAFSSFPSALEALPSMEELDLSGNAVASLPPRTPKSAAVLQCLRLRYCELTQFPEQMTALPALTMLNLAGNGIAELPEKFSRLVSLTELDLAHNAFEEFPAAVLRLDKLELLNLNRNGLAALPSTLWQLQRLRELRVRANKLESVPTCIGQLTRLEVLDLRDNLIEELRPTLGLLSALTSLRIEGNKLTQPLPEDLDELVRYFQEQLRGNVHTYRIKLIIVGSENVGKTTLLRSLRTRKRTLSSSSAALHNLSTDGIRIDDWTMNMQFEEKDETGRVVTAHKQDVQMSVWDFAGQNIYGTTHQFFLSSRAAYIVAWNMEQPIDQSSLKYWLCNIRMRAPRAPVIIVGTHRDKMSSGAAAKQIVQAALEKYSPILKNAPLSGFSVSCITDEGITKLREGIETMLRQHPYVHQNVPGSFLVLEQLVLEERTLSLQPVLSWSGFRTLASSCSIKEEEEALRAADFLNTMGTIVHFADDPELRDLVVLDPQWLSDVFCTLITTKGNYASSSGILSTRNLQHLWKPPRFPPETHSQLLTLLERFEIVLNISGRRTKDLTADPVDLLVPSVLPETEPTSDVQRAWPRLSTTVHQAGRNFIFRQFMPPGFFSRLIVRVLNAVGAVSGSAGGGAGSHIIWRHGLLLMKETDVVLIEELAEQATVRAAVRGPAPAPMARLVFDAIDTLFTEVLRPTIQTVIPCVHCVAEGASDVRTFPIEECERAAIAGEQFMRCGMTAVRTDHVAPDLSLADCDVPKVQFKDIAIESVLGEGAAATVHRGRYRGRAVAVKQLKVDPGAEATRGIGSRAFTEFRREAWVMSEFKHPCIVELVGLCMQPLCILTEFVPHGNLFRYAVDKKQTLEMPFALKVAHDVASAMAFLHGASPPQLHRDLKSPNVLLRSLSERDPVAAKVADFGLTGFAFTIALQVDNPIWLAPEVMQNEEPTTASDVYSFGVILWEMIAREQYFHDVTFMSLLETKVISGERPAIPACPTELKALIESCWANDPATRPPFSAIVQDLSRLITKGFPTVNMCKEEEAATAQRAKAGRLSRVLTPHTGSRGAGGLHLKPPSVDGQQRLSSRALPRPKPKVPSIVGATGAAAKVVAARGGGGPSPLAALPASAVPPVAPVAVKATPRPRPQPPTPMKTSPVTTTLAPPAGPANSPSPPPLPPLPPPQTAGGPHASVTPRTVPPASAKIKASPAPQLPPQPGGPASQAQPHGSPKVAPVAPSLSRSMPGELERMGDPKHRSDPAPALEQSTPPIVIRQQHSSHSSGEQSTPPIGTRQQHSSHSSGELPVPPIGVRQQHSSHSSGELSTHPSQQSPQRAVAVGLARPAVLALNPPAVSPEKHDTTRTSTVSVKLETANEASHEGGTPVNTISAVEVVEDSMWIGRSDGTIVVWNVKRSTVTNTIRAHEGAVLAMASTAQGVWTAGGDKKVKMFNGYGLALFTEARSAVTSFARSGRFVCGSGMRGEVRVWNTDEPGTFSAIITLGDLKNTEATAICSPLAGSSSSSSSSSPSPPGMLWVAVGTALVVVNPEARSVERSLLQAHPTTIRSLAAVGEDAVWSGSEGLVRVWNAATGAAKHSVDIRATSGAAVTRIVALQTSGGLVLTCSHSAILLWRASDAQVLSEFQQFHTFPVVGLCSIGAVDPSTTRLASISSDGSLAIWLVSERSRQSHQRQAPSATTTTMTTK